MVVVSWKSRWNASDLCRLKQLQNQVDLVGKIATLRFRRV